jgi:flagellar protein FlbD
MGKAGPMIHLTRINHLPLVLNSDLIEHVEANPDTVISLTTGQKLIVLETPPEVVDRVVQFRRSLLARSPAELRRLFAVVPETAGCSDDESEEC